MKVLLAEPDVATVTRLAELLGAHGYDVVPCATHTDAWERLAEAKQWVAVISNDLASFGGSPLCQRIRAHGPLEFTYTIQLFHTRQESLKQAFSNGANDFLVAPFSDEELLARVATGTSLIETQYELSHIRKLSSLGELSSGIAHEINTPIQYVGDNTRFLRDAIDDFAAVLDQYGGLLEACKSENVTTALLADVEAAIKQVDVPFLLQEAPSAIEESLQGVERVASIVRAMKEFAHPGTGEKGEVDLHEAIRNTVTVARNEWKYVAEVVFELGQDLPPVPCSASDINQVLLNIIVTRRTPLAVLTRVSRES